MKSLFFLSMMTPSELKVSSETYPYIWSQLDKDTEHVILVNGRAEGVDVRAGLPNAPPEVTFIESESNLGIPLGRNRMIELALKKGADILVICDCDILVMNDYAARIRRTIEQLTAAYPNLGIMAPLLMDGPSTKDFWQGKKVGDPDLTCDHLHELAVQEGSRVVYHAGVIDWPRNYFFLGQNFGDKRLPKARVPCIPTNPPREPTLLADGSDISDKLSAKDVLEVDSLPGGVHIITRDVYDLLGAYDIRFGLYGFEDVEYSLRARSIGLRNFMIGRAPVIHDIRDHPNIGARYYSHRAALRGKILGYMWRNYFRTRSGKVRSIPLILLWHPYVLARGILSNERKLNEGMINVSAIGRMMTGITNYFRYLVQSVFWRELELGGAARHVREMHLPHEIHRNRIAVPSGGDPKLPKLLSKIRSKLSGQFRNKAFPTMSLKEKLVSQVKRARSVLQDPFVTSDSTYQAPLFQKAAWKLRYWSVSRGLPLTRNEIRIRRHKNIYAGKRAFLIGNGPSLNKLDLTKLKNEITFGVNGIYLAKDKMGFLPTHYIVEDFFVAEDRAPEINELRGTTKWFGNYLQYCLKDSPDTIWLNILMDYRNHPHFPNFSEDAPRCLWVGGTVSYIAMQLAYYMGVRELILVGFDHSYEIPQHVEQTRNDLLSHGDDPNHFHPDYFGNGYRWHDPKVDRMEQAYRKAKVYYEKDKRRILNATKGGMLEVYQRVDYETLFA